jgi:type III pantothenate kinase
VRPASIIGRSTTESIQAGLYFQNLYALKGLCEEIKAETFGGKNTLVLGTGGFARMFENEGVFSALIPELVLNGLNLALRLNL